MSKAEEAQARVDAAAKLVKDIDVSVQSCHAMIEVLKGTLSASSDDDSVQRLEAIRNTFRAVRRDAIVRLYEAREEISTIEPPARVGRQRTPLRDVYVGDQIRHIDCPDESPFVVSVNDAGEMFIVRGGIVFLRATVDELNTIPYALVNS